MNAPDPAAAAARRWRRVRELFDAALDLPSGAREAFLRAEADADVVAEVRALLAADAAPAAGLAAGPAPNATRGAPPAPPPLGGRVGPWRLDAVLGRGGMGTVYRAVDDAGDAVALKCLDAPIHDATAAARFTREVRLGGRLRHPHLLHVADALHAGGRPWLTMPLVDGETLRERLRRAGPLPPAEAARVAAALADALAALHAAGVVHRDLKPENVLLARAPVRGVPPGDGVPPTPARPQPLLADFGIARALSAAGDEALTRAGLLVGTPTYMSPERFAGLPVDAAVDVWALGVVLYEMLAGAPPWRGAALRAMLAGEARAGAPDVRAARPDAPAGHAALVARLLAPARTERVADAAAARDALATVAASAG